MTDFGPKVVVSEKQNRPKAGSFSIKANPLDWMYCRERFDTFFTCNTKQFFFSCDSKTNPKPIAQFIWKTEEILGQNKRTEFCKTNRNYCLAIHPSDFWRQCPMRRSLLTILLRCGIKYIPGENNYEDALFSQRYLKDTENAIRRFMFGFTKLWETNKVSYTWVASFKNVDIDVCRKRLLSPDIPQEGMLLGAGTIWR